MTLVTFFCDRGIVKIWVPSQTKILLSLLNLHICLLRFEKYSFFFTNVLRHYTTPKANTQDIEHFSFCFPVKDRSVSTGQD